MRSTGQIRRAVRLFVSDSNPDQAVCIADVVGKFLHESERPACFGMYLCGCEGCRIALEVTGRTFDNTRVIIKFSDQPRRVLHWRTYCDAWDRGREGAADAPSALGLQVTGHQVESPWV